MNSKVLFTSEAVGQGHPDKICDQIADRILDACLQRDPDAQVAAEVLATQERIVLAGEITSREELDSSVYERIARETVRDIGYTDAESGLGWESMAVENYIKQQSPNIRQGVLDSADTHDIGAGDQGMMFGYATDETENLMPLAYVMAQKIVRTADALRHRGELPGSRPDLKTQVTIDYTDPNHPAVNAIVLSSQHEPGIDREAYRQMLLDRVLTPVVTSFGYTLPEESEIHINSTGEFVIGGPLGDTGLTGRKIIVDTYGGACPHGGGSFSGKNPTKVDRTGAYMARYVAKNIVAAGLARECLVQVAYAIGVSEPVSVSVDTRGTGSVHSKTGREADRLILEAVLRNRALFDFTPRGIIDKFSLTHPSFRYADISNYGHFGRPDLDLPWERLDAAGYLRGI